MPIKNVRASVDLEFDCFGSKEHDLVLLIPGAGAPMQFWPEAFCRQLAERSFFVVRYCHRDTGSSTHFDDPYAMDELLGDMTALLSALGAPPAHLVGHSMGGYLAQLAICKFPGRFLSATSMSAGPTVTPHIAAALGMTGPTDAVWEILMRNQPTGVFEQDLDGWMTSWRFLNGNRPFDEAMALEYTRSLYVGDPRNGQVAENHIHAMSTVPEALADDLKQVDCPLLVIHGAEDPLVPIDNGQASARLVPSSTVHVLQDAGHMFFDMAIWEEIESALISHIRRCCQ